MAESIDFTAHVKHGSRVAPAENEEEDAPQGEQELESKRSVVG